MTKTKRWNKVLSMLLALALVLSLAPAMTLTARAEETDTGVALENGMYSVPLVQCNSDQDKTASISRALHFGANGILEIEEENCSLTIAIENWSLYEAFIPRKQGYVNDSFQYLPASVFNEDAAEKFTNFEFTTYQDVIDANSENYKTSSAETKYGDIEIDAESHKNIDVAYVTFELDDYKSVFSFSAWFNTPAYIINPIENKYNDYQWANISFYLNVDEMFSIGALLNNEVEELKKSHDHL